MDQSSLPLRTVTRSFFDRGAVTRAMDAQTKSVLSKFGAYVRTAAKSLIRKARQKTLGELTPEELLAYKIQAAAAKERGQPRPKRPLAASRPGDPPRSVLGFLKKFIYFAWDADRKSVVIGPALFGGAKGKAPRALEEGGTVVLWNGKSVRIEPRPYMRPAFDAELPKVPSLWATAASQFGAKAA